MTADDADVTSLSPADETGHETQVAVEVHRDSAAAAAAYSHRRHRRPSSVDIVRWSPLPDRCLRRWHTDGQHGSPPHDAADLEVAAILVRPRDVISSFDESEAEPEAEVRAATRRCESTDASKRGDRRDSPLVHVDRLWALREAYEEQDRQTEEGRTDETVYPADDVRPELEVPSTTVTAPAWHQAREFTFSFDSGDTCTTDESSRQGAPTTSFESSTDGTDASGGRGPKLHQFRDDSGYKSIETVPVPAAHAAAARDDVGATRGGATKSRSLDGGRNGKTASRRRRDYRRERHPIGDETARAPASDDTHVSAANSRRRVSRDYSIDEHTDAIFNEFMRYDPALPDVTRATQKRAMIVDRAGRCRIADSKSRSLSIGYSGEGALSSAHDKMYAHLRRLSKQNTCSSARERQSSLDRSCIYEHADTYDERPSHSQDVPYEYRMFSHDRTDSRDRRLAHHKTSFQASHCAER